MPPVHKARSIKNWFPVWCERQNTPAASFQHLMESLKPEEWKLLEQHINAHGFGITYSTVTHVCNLEVSIYYYKADMKNNQNSTGFGCIKQIWYYTASNLKKMWFIAVFTWAPRSWKVSKRCIDQFQAATPSTSPVIISSIYIASVTVFDILHIPVLCLSNLMHFKYTRVI